MRNSWKKLIIGNEINLLGGFPFSSVNFNDSGIGTPLIRIRDLQNSSQETYFDGVFSNAFLIKEQDILIGMDGDFHIVKWKNSPSLLNQRILKVSEKKGSEINIDYLFYYLHPFLLNVHAKTAATTVKHLSTFDISRAVDVFPPLPQQRKIAHILSTCDEVIEKTEAAIAKYQAMKQGMMHDLFTRGIDLKTGKLRPTYQDAPELYKESELGMIPKEWEGKKLGDCGVFKKGSNIPKYLLTPNGVSCVLYGQLYTRFQNVIEKTETRIPENNVKGMTPLNYGEILFAGSGETHAEIGKSAVFLSEELVYAGGDILILSLYANHFKPYFGYFLNFEPIQKQKARLGQGSSVIHIYSAHLGSIKLALPKEREQELIYEKINAIAIKISVEQSTLSKYQQLKAGLMQDLLTGKVEVSIGEEEMQMNS